MRPGASMPSSSVSGSARSRASTRAAGLNCRILHCGGGCGRSIGFQVVRKFRIFGKAEFGADSCWNADLGGGRVLDVSVITAANAKLRLHC